MPRRSLSRFLLLTLILSGVEGWAQSGLSLSKTALVFGVARIKRGVTDTIVVGNAGAGDLVVDGLDLGTSPFSAPPGSVTGSFTMRPGESRPVVVRFTPPAIGTFRDTLLIRLQASPVRVPVAGTGVRSTVVINEVLADPASGPDGDANGDGIRDSFTDEFAEVLNVGLRPEAIGGWRLSDDDTAVGSQFAFPPGTVLPPGARAVLFGGGGTAGVPGLVFKDDGRIGNGLTNGGDRVLLVDPTGPDTLDTVVFGGEGDQDQALVRFPEGTGGLALHGDPPGDGTRFSPGRARVTLSALTITPADTEAAPGDSVAWRGTGVFSDGRTREVTTEAVWSSSDTGVVRVVSGRGKALRVGEALVRAAFAGVGGTAAVLRVRGPLPSQLAILPPETTVVVGGVARFEVEGVLPGGGRQAMSQGLSWTVGDTTVAGFAGDTSFRGKRAGETTVRVSDGRLTTPSALLKVVAKGDLNGTSGVEVADALRLIDLILEVAPPPTVLERAGGDLNGDGRIDVADLTAIIDVMLGRPLPAGKPAWDGVAYQVVGDGDGAWELVLDNPAEVAGVQVDLTGQVAGVRLTARSDGMALAYAPGPDGGMRVLLYDLSGGRLPPGRGPVLRFGSGAVSRVTVATGMSRLDLAVEGPGGVPQEAGEVAGFRLHQSFPNPANAGVAIGYALPEAARVTLDVFDLLGRRVIRLVEGFQGSGAHRVRWEGRDQAGRRVGSGVYLYRLVAGPFVQVRKMIWVK